LFDAVGSQALADVDTVIICIVPVEITAISVHSLDWRHFNHDVHKVAFFWIGPLIHLDEDAVLVEVEVQDLQVFTRLTVWLQDLSVVVEGNVDDILEVVRAWECSKDWCVVHGHTGRGNSKDVALHGCSANADFLGHRQAAGDVRWQETSLN